MLSISVTEAGKEEFEKFVTRLPIDIEIDLNVTGRTEISDYSIMELATLDNLVELTLEPDIALANQGRALLDLIRKSKLQTLDISAMDGVSEKVIEEIKEKIGEREDIDFLIP